MDEPYEWNVTITVHQRRGEVIYNPPVLVSKSTFGVTARGDISLISALKDIIQQLGGGASGP